MLLAGCAHPPPGELAFALLGDTPYSASEVERLDRLIGDLNAEALDLVVHLGDLGASREACGDAWLDARKRQLAAIHHPVVVVPGDNEWSDCRDPAARLAAWRSRFCGTPLGAARLGIEVQPGEYCEHRRWQMAGVLFAVLNVPGNHNNVRERAEHERRMAAVLAWLDDCAAQAASRGLTLVVLMHAEPFLALPPDGYARLRERFARLGRRMPGRVVLAHGDMHLYVADEPWPGVRRLEVWGSPFVSWVRADVRAGALGFSAPRYR